MKTIIYTENAPQPIGPYSQAVKVGELVFVSGQIPLDPETGELVKGTVSEQTHIVFKNIEAILNAADSSLDKVVKISVFLKDLADFEEVNQVFELYFKSEHPARETVQVARLPKDANVEISVVAASE
ncbi:MAG: RidA family protein [Actinobacteria bacterium]|nr:MAG: RidA family protein [Actinomycetota bacterium]